LQRVLLRSHASITSCRKVAHVHRPISNLIGYVLDIPSRETGYTARGVRIPAYADDLTFPQIRSSFAYQYCAPTGLSINGRRDPRLINRAPHKRVSAKSRQDPHAVSGFSSSCDWSNCLYRKINVRREYRHLTRALVHSLFTTGSFELRTKTVDDVGNVTVTAIPGTIPQLRGCWNSSTIWTAFNGGAKPTEVQVREQISIFRAREFLYPTVFAI